MAYISNTLTHFAGSGLEADEQYDIFATSILRKKRLRYGLCNWDFFSKYGGVRKGLYQIPMICFADIPLGQTSAHAEKYSKFGLSFAKHYLANCHASPVGYVQSPHTHYDYSYVKLGLHTLIDYLAENQIDQTFVNETNERTYSVEGILTHFQLIMNLMEDCGGDQEFLYHEVDSTPLDGQQAFFEDGSKKYYEREWRISARPGYQELPWNQIEGDFLYFNFEPAYLSNVIVPRSHVEQFKRESSSVFATYDPAEIPPILTYEDLAFM